MYSPKILWHHFIFLFALILFMMNGLFSQVLTTPRLEKRLKNSSKEEFIKCIIVLKEQVDTELFDIQYHLKRFSLSRQHEQIITELKETADVTQAFILNKLEDYKREELVKYYKSFWIINAIALSAKPKVIERLKDLGTILYMDLDVVLEIDEPVEREPAPIKFNSCEPGLKVINAHKLWEKGVTGEDVIVMNIDTGVDGNHPALAARWLKTSD